MPGESSGMPQDDAMMELELKRKMKFADALRNQETPQGQMVSGHYVAPSITQHLAGLANKYQAGQQEQEAMKQYGEAQTSKAKKYADLLSETDNVKFQQGLAQIPEFAPELVKSRLSMIGKKTQPVVVGKSLVNPDTGQVIYQGESEEKTNFGNVNPSDFTPQSLAKFAQSGGKDYSVLIPAPKQVNPAQPYFQAVPTAQGYARFNARTGQMETLPLNGQSVLPAAQSPQLQGDIAGARTGGEAKAKREFNMAGAGGIVENARNILTGKVKPTGSGAGTLVDTAGAIVGYAPKGAAQADQLRAIGGQLVAKMPRMEGPQSDRDVQLYTQMAGQIGDSTIPVSRRLEALKTVEGIVNKYAPQQGASISAQDQQALQWANSNPNDPRAIAIKQKLGVK